MTATAPKVVARGTLVVLREKSIEDASQDYEWRKDSELAAYDAAHPLTMSLRAYVATVADEIETPSLHRRSYSIDTIDDGRHIGNVMYYSYDRNLRETEIGVTIGDRDYWSQGYGSDAVRALLEYLFDELRVNRVYLHTLTWNDRARQAFIRAGFKATGEVHRGSYDFVEMEIVRDEFLAQRAGD